MQIFPAFSHFSSTPDHALTGRGDALLAADTGGFGGVFDTYRRDSRQDPPYHATVQDSPMSGGKQPGTAPIQVHEDSSSQNLHQDNPVDREDFALLRGKLEELGVDAETLDQIEDLFENPDQVTWEQILDVLRDPLEKKAKITLSVDQEKNLINLFNKMGFTPHNAMDIFSKISDNKYDSVWKSIQQVLSSLKNDENISMKSQQISALLHALGLKKDALVPEHAKPAAAEAGNAAKLLDAAKNILPGLDPNILNALQKLADTATGDDLITRPEILTNLREALNGNTKALQNILNAAAKGDLKLTPETLSVLQTILNSNQTDTAKLEKFLEQAVGKELTPDQLRNILALLKDSVTGREHSGKAARDQVNSEMQKAMTTTEHGERRMVAADTGVNSQRLSTAEALNALKAAAPNGDGKDRGFTDQKAAGNSGNDNRNAQSGMNKSALGWESFWNKVNVRGSADSATATVREPGVDPRVILGQNTAATTAEAAASRLLSNAPAPHRAVLNQVNSGLLQNLGQGRQQLTLQLSPADLGSLTVNLKVVGKEIQAVLRAENQEARQIIAENMPLLRQSLEAQGLRVSRLEVQTQMQDQSQFTQLWHGTDGQKFQEHGAKTQWSALGRGQVKNAPAADHDVADQAALLRALGREGGINLIA